jgi:hypothetical protein
MCSKSGSYPKHLHLTQEAAPWPQYIFFWRLTITVLALYRYPVYERYLAGQIVTVVRYTIDFTINKPFIVRHILEPQRTNRHFQEQYTSMNQYCKTSPNDEFTRRAMYIEEDISTTL